jgi:ribose-phosphate pyrophosphokinase
MVKTLENLKVFAGDENVKLGRDVCSCLGVSFGDIYLHTFPSGEKYCQLKENVRGADVFLLQSIAQPANDNLMQLLIMADAARRASAERITAVIPYFGYSRQDRKDKPRVPISAKLVMNMLAAAGVNRIMTMDLHAQQIQGFTDLPVDHLLFRPVLVDAMRNDSNYIEVVVAPDTGALKKAEEFSQHMKVDLAFISKKRKDDINIEVTQFVGDVKDKNVLIVDDLTESAGTLIGAAKCCRENGAKNVYCAVTHNCLGPLGIYRLNNASMDGIITKFYSSDTTNRQPSTESLMSMTTLSVAPLFAKAIRGVFTNESISSLFV